MPPATATGNDTKAPKAAAPMVNINRYGPAAAALNEVVVGPFRHRCKGRETASDPPGDQADAVHRDPAQPGRVRVAGRCADLLTESSVNSRKTHSSTNRTGTTIIVSTDMPLNTTPPTCRCESEGLRERRLRCGSQTRDVGERQQYLAHADRQDQQPNG